ncbi:MAG TPA: CAP domain-containing protein [Luteolibacter sp.]|nr:CAP domain-containing protein [Luteolibacter sp.]
MTGLLMTQAVTGQTRYDFGNPNAEEQLHIERINRARANPSAEGQRLAATTDPNILAAYAYFNVNLAMMQSEFNAITAAPPLAPNGALTVAARGHSEWMLANNVQQHDQYNPYNTSAMRMQAAGYDSQTVGENIYSYCKYGDYGHAGFQVDWGPGTGGMLNGRGHRVNIHKASYREIGVGVIIGGNGIYPNVGPQLITQNFGTRAGHPSFATGVAYYDLNSNDTYDIGEGISGLRVDVSGADYYCETAAGGGWVVPVPAQATTRTVTFSGLNANHGTPLAIPLNQNAKADLKLSYAPPAITSAATATANESHTLTFQPVTGATAYQCTAKSMAAAAGERCESTVGILTQTTGTYPILSTGVKYEGASSFHLLNSTGHSQWLELNRDFFGGSSPSISFQSRIRYATSDEKFLVQVQESGGTTWQTVNQQIGTNGPGQSGFIPRSIALPSMAGKSFRVRFRLDFNYSGYGYYPNDTEIVGWFIDDIRFTDILQTQILASGTVAGTTWTFAPSLGEYLLNVAPVISGRTFPTASQIVQTVESTQSGFDAWAANHESAAGLPPGSLADPHGDADKDGRCNLIEYALGGSPVSTDDPPGSVPESMIDGTHFVLRYRVDTSLDDVIVTPQACPTLGSWKSPGESGTPDGFTVETVATEGTYETREARIPIDGPTRCFLRLRVHRP